MMVFSLMAVVLVAATLLFVLPSLLGTAVASGQAGQSERANLTVLRDQLRELDSELASGGIDAGSYESAKQELARRVAEDVPPSASSTGAARPQPWMALALGLVIPALAASLYLGLGSPAGLSPSQVTAPKEQAHALTEAQILDMVSALAQRLRDRPTDIEGWSMLARSYNALGRYAEAAQAYGRLVELAPGDVSVLADYADTVAMSRNKSLLGEPERLIARALALEPNNIKALALAGSAAFERRDFALAIGHWNKILALVPPESDIARSTQGSIRHAQSLAAEPLAAGERQVGGLPARSGTTGQASRGDAP